jgi:two-component system, cell cycle sensor histidine kinase and response regulator CckA
MKKLGKRAFHVARRAPPEAAEKASDSSMRQAADQAAPWAVTGAQPGYRSFFEHAADGIFRTTPEGRLLDANPALARLLGYASPAELLASVHDLGRQVYAHPGQREMYRQQLAQSGFVTDRECQFKQRQGTLVWVALSIRALRRPDDHALFYEGTVEDISARKRARAKMRRQAALLDISPDAILVLELDGRVNYANSGFERIFGWSVAEILDRKICPEALAECGGAFKEACQAALADGHWQGELVIRGKDQQRIVVSSRCTLVRDELGNPSAFLVVNSDVTEQKKLEAQVLRMQREESAGRLANGVAHDLNNMLAPIIIASDLLSQKDWDKEDREFVDMIKTSALRGAEMIKQLLLYCRGTDGAGRKLEPAKLTREMARFAQETFPKNIQIKMDLSPGVWPIEGDPTQFQQILVNLCVNARDAMPQGGILGLGLEKVKLDAISCGSRPELKPGHYVVLRVWDSGSGIPEEILPKIFDPYFTTKPEGQGTGLGLATVRGIVKGWGGFIEVESQVGLGTQFLVYLPAWKAGRVSQNLEPEPVDYLGHGELVLVVDDEELIRQSARRTLELYGYRTISASHGLQALSIYKKRAAAIEVVLLDMWMPYLDGMSTILELEKINPAAKVIATSGLVEFREKAKRVSPVVQAFLAKPWQRHQLLKTLHQVLNAKKHPASLNPR